MILSAATRLGLNRRFPDDFLPSYTLPGSSTGVVKLGLSLPHRTCDSGQGRDTASAGGGCNNRAVDCHALHQENVG